MRISEEDIHKLVEQARTAFTNRQPEVFHKAFSKDCERYVPKEGSLDCYNCNLVVPFSHEMLEEAINHFQKENSA